ncbi:MAG: hypothetical protein HQL31_03760 [Planctomycetes bacterium]|nr:hypothetical protein [Planctomycetota bacterium]
MTRMIREPKIESPQELLVGINYYEMPLLGRQSFLQLAMRPGLLGFSNCIAGTVGWKGLGSPFLRVGALAPHTVRCEPEAVTQIAEGATLTALFLGQDSVAIEILCDQPQVLYCGAPGRLTAVAGSQCQDWFSFDSLREGSSMEKLAPDTMRLSHPPSHAVCMVDGVRINSAANGWCAPLPAGRTCIGLGMDYDDLDVALTRAKRARERLGAVLGSEELLEDLRREWRAIFERLPFAADTGEPLRAYARHALWCLLSNAIAPTGNIHHPAIVAAKTQYPAIFPWDSAFAALALKDADPGMARAQILNYTDIVAEDGYLGVTSITRKDGSPQFPLFSWAAWRIYQAEPDGEFLSSIYPALSRHAEWWVDSPMGSHQGIPVYRESMCLDDSPRFFIFAGEGRMSLKEGVFSPDLVCFCMRDRLYLARIAEVLGRGNEAREHRAVAERLRKFCDKQLYDKRLGRYIDKGVGGGVSPVDSPFAHFPALLMSRDDELRKGSALSLGPKGPFWGRFGLTSVAAEDPCFDPYRGFRGAIWHALNFYAADCLWQTGYKVEADQVARSSFDLMLTDKDMGKGFRENYNWLSGRGTGAHHFPTLSAGPFLSMVLKHYREE